MRKLFYIMFSVSLVLLAVGCGGEAETAVPDQPAAPVEVNSDTQTVMARPQLIEFYADW